MKSSTMHRGIGIATLILSTVLSVSTASAELPDAATILGDFGYSAGEIESLKAGKIVPSTIKAGTPRELVGAFAFFVKVPPAELVKDLKAGLLASVDANQLSRGMISGDGSLADFAKLELAPKTEDRIQAYLEADDDLNLSAEEAAAFKALAAAGNKSREAVEAQVRALLLARYQAYRAKGLAGIAPYARGSGKTRSVADELAAANAGSVPLKKYAPAFHAALSSYPAAKPAGFDEGFAWTQFDAHGEPTIALVHGMFMPDGDGFVAIQRQFYVSEGFNCEQAVAGFLPVTGGTLVVYGNRTSTDQVEGTGGSFKRSIGSKLLSSELEGIFAKLQSAAK
jgi:hypothetical protein